MLVRVAELGRLQRIVTLPGHLVGGCESHNANRGVFSVKNGVWGSAVGRPYEFCLEKNVFWVTGCMQRALERWLRACGVW
jgi:hypothetical protein